ncbi:MAG: hypothetical protein AAF633_19695 [Chloroflexota bacterium]
MVSNRWQKKQTYIQHAALILFLGSPFLWLQLEITVAYKILLILMSSIMGVYLGSYVNDYFAKKMVRVFRFEEDITLSIVQRTLNARYIRFNRKHHGDQVDFALREHGLTLRIEPFPLNLPIDDQIKTVDASLVEIQGINQSNQPFVNELCAAIDKNAIAILST